MADRKNFNTPLVPRSTDIFPQAVIVDSFIYISGTTGIDPLTSTLHENFEVQARQSFSNIRTILEEAGSKLENVFKTTVYMVAGNDFGTLNKVYKEYFPENAPARSVPQVLPFPSGILISVECIATM